MKLTVAVMLIMLMAGLCPAKEAPQPAQVRNLTAFARLWGYVKHWYPSDEAQEIDWDRFAAQGSAQVQNARDTEELRDILVGLFQPIVPELILYTDSKPNFKPALPASRSRKAFWQYRGYDNTGTGSVYCSFRANRPYRIMKNEGSPYVWAQISPQLPPNAELGSKVRLSFRISQAETDTLEAMLYAGFGSASSSDSLTSAGWTDKSYVLESEENPEIPLWLVFMNFDCLRLDDLRVESWRDGNWQEVFRSDFSTDKPGSLPDRFNINIAPFDSNPSDNMDIWVEEPEHDLNNVLTLQRSQTGLPYTLGIAARIFAEEPEWDDMVDKQLVPGLFCRFPQVLGCDLERTYPQADTARLNTLKQNYAAIDLQDRTDPRIWLAGVIKYWNELQFFYPYFEYGFCDWEQELPLALGRVLRCRDFAQYKQALLLLMSQTRDGHAFLSDQSHNSKMPNFNIRLLDGKWIVYKVLDDSLGIPAGSEVTRLNGNNFAKLMQENRPYFIAGNPETTDRRLFSRFLKTWPDSVATFDVITPEGKKIRRELVLEEYEGWKWETPDQKIVKYLDGIVYVNPNAITDQDLQDAMPDLLAARGIILDLRFYLHISTDLISQLLTQPDSLANILIKRYIRPNEELPRRDEDKPAWGSRPREPHIGARVVALSSRNSQSYCEQFLAVLKHNKLATIVGTPTSGANGNVVLTPLPGDIEVYWTGMLVRQADKSRFQGVGIIPDVLVETSLEDIVQGRDPVLEKGLEVLRSSR